MIVPALFGAIFFTAAGVVGAVLGVTFAENIEGFPDGPRPEKAPIPLLVAACALIGAFLTARGTPPLQTLLLAVVCLALVAIFIVDTRRGIVPDAFTLGPLALVLVLALRQHDWGLLGAAVLPLLPFAAIALFSKGRGMGWGDVKLAALGGAVLGAQWATIAFMAACFAAVVTAYARGRQKDPLAFGPYLSAAIGVAIPMAVLH